MHKSMIAVAALTMAGSATAQAQETVYWSAPPVPHGQYSYIPMGTPLRLTTQTELSTKENHAGDRFDLRVADAIVYRGQTVLPAGSLAVGEVVRAERNGHFGKRGEMAVHLLYVQTPGGPVRLTGRAERKGTGQEVLAIGGGTLIWWPMVFIHGTSARLPAETTVTAYLADDLRFPTALPGQVAISDATPAPLPARFDPATFSGARP